MQLMVILLGDGPSSFPLCNFFVNLDRECDDIIKEKYGSFFLRVSPSKFTRILHQRNRDDPYPS